MINFMYEQTLCMYDQFYVYELLVLILSFRCCAIMKMSRQWMYEADRCSSEFVNGLHSFLQVAEANKRDGFMCCPCGVCKNNKSYSDSKDIHLHLFKHGFMLGYNCWTKHGERGVLMEENEEDEDDDRYPGFLPKYGGTMGEENEEQEGEEKASVHEPDDELDRVIVDAQRGCESEREKLKFNRMLEDHRKGLYPNC